MSKKKLRVLIIDDTIEDIEFYKRLLTKLYNCDFTQAKMVREGINKLEQETFDIIYLDYFMPDMTGIDLLNYFNEKKGFSCPVIVLTGQGNEEVATSFLKLGASDYISKNNLNLESMRRLTESALEKFAYKKLLEQKHQALYNFSDIIAHDLKSPINRIFTYAKLLNNTSSTDSERNKRYAEDIYEDSVYCIEFIDALYMYSKIGRSEQTFSKIDLNEVLDRALKNLSLEIKKKSSEIIVESLPVIVGDKIALIQLFQNLIANSVKFNLGLVKIKVLYKKIDDEFFNIYVSDNGIGIPEEKMADIFTPFSRSVNAKGFEGFGLGLALCQMIVEQHKGEISVNSKINEGTIFSIKLPINQDLKLDK